jgi:hypothetical protein
MRTLSLSLVLGIVLTSPILMRTAQIGDPFIESPHPGDVLQGVVKITGSSDMTRFVSAEVSFTYTDDSTGTWFLIDNVNLPISYDTLASWDTTVITDGNYVLRLKVYLTDGSSREVLVTDLRVRNYTPVETSTPIPLALEATSFPTITPTVTPFPTPTVLRRNPATLAQTDVSISILFGGLAAILSFIIIGIYLWLRRK